jgi:hypothetical protein
MKVKILLSVIVSAVLLLVPCAFAQPMSQYPLNSKALSRFQNALKQEGFDVSYGRAEAWNPTADWCDYKIDSAQGVNNEPYLQVLIPKSSQDPGYPGLTQDFQLRQDESIVLIGLTPPPVKYFSYTPYLYTRVYPDGRRSIFASLGDQLNNAVIKSIGKSPFNSPVALIFTPDQSTDARIRAALRSAGYPAAIINTVVIPAAMLNLGHNETADVLRIITRTAVWQDKTAGDSYINNPPLSVLRVTPRVQAPAKPFPTPPLRIRGTGHTEMALMNKLGELRQGIIAAYPGLHATDIQSIPMCYEGYDLIQRGNWCGDSRDAFYIGAGYLGYATSDPASTDLTLEDDEFLMVYGVNHVATGKATYMNLNFYADKKAALFVGSLSDNKFPAAASFYLPGDPAVDVMYAYKVSRNCNEGEAYCLPLSVPEGCTRLTLDSSTVLTVFDRIYLEPATKVGPAMPEILYDRVIKFSPRP